MRRFVLVLMVFFFSISILAGQEMSADVDQSAGVFPLTLVLDAAGLTGNGLGTELDYMWRPDWPMELPPDSFKVQNGTIRRAVVEGDGVSLVLRYGPDGWVEEFPFMLNGRMAQVSFIYNEFPEIPEMTLAFYSGEDPYRFEFLEYDDPYSAMVRASCGEFWYFISLSKRGNVIMETWYDEEGLALGAYAFSLIKIGDYPRISAFRDYRNPGVLTEFFYDSRNLLTESSWFGGVFKVLYFREDLPRYWERRPFYFGDVREGATYGGRAGNFTLQWDESSFLVRIAGEAGIEPAEYRYEYSLDEKGNWIERREIRMVHRFGILVPTPGTVFKRVLEYSITE